MKHFIVTLADSCDDLMWLVVFLIEAACLYAIFTHTDAIYELAQFNWVLVTIPIILPALALLAYGMPFEIKQKR